MVQMEFNPDFGKKLRELRYREGKMSLRELARRTGISPSYLSQIEQGKLPPPLSNITLLSKFAEELNTDPGELISLAKTPGHLLADLLVDNPEIPKLIAEKLLDMDTEQLRDFMIDLTLPDVLKKNFGKKAKQPTLEEMNQLFEDVLRIHRVLRARNES